MTLIESLERRTLLSLAAGDLDPSFGQGGLFSPVGSDAHAGALAVQSDGMILVASQAGPVGSRDFVLTRYDAGGRPDPDFGRAGRVIADFGGDDVPNAMLVQPDGRILVAGRNDNRFAAVRFDERHGDLDVTFGQGGRMTLADAGAASAMTLDASGRILVGGYTSGHGERRPAERVVMQVGLLT